MPVIIWWIVGGVFGVPLFVLLALVLVNRFGKGKTGKVINLLWLLLAVMLAVFLGIALFGGVK
ncbi:MAG TPA: hypothetical protein VNT75_27940 [Symbiobacteriaceae bacterium]|nr:hypothetical protein [Symbiobacteriaceae bacterium]